MNEALREKLAHELVRAWNSKNGFTTPEWSALSEREKDAALFQADAALAVMRQEMLK